MNDCNFTEIRNCTHKLIKLQRRFTERKNTPVKEEDTPRVPPSSDKCVSFMFL